MFIINNRKNKGEQWISVIKYNNKMYAYDTFNRDIHIHIHIHIHILEEQ